ncbi:unnamed protein product [Rhodiola kirilowii]
MLKRCVWVVIVFLTSSDWQPQWIRKPHFFPPTSFILSAQIPRRIKMAAASTLSCCPTAAHSSRSIRLTSQSLKVVPVTVVGFKEGNIVTQVKTEATDGYNAVQVGYRRIRDRKLTKPELGHLQKADVIPMRHLQEFRLQSVDGFETSQKLDFQELFKEGDLVDVAGDTIGKGFQATDISLILFMRCLVGNIEM